MDLLTANDRPGHYPDSYYAATAPLLDAFPPAASLPQEARRADVAIVGAGYAGLVWTVMALLWMGWAVHRAMQDRRS